jgi:ABC-type methionine transport system ATPase subunit
MTADRITLYFLGGFAREEADRVAFMDEGRIIEIAPPTDFFLHPPAPVPQDIPRQNFDSLKTANRTNAFRRTARTMISVHYKAVGSVRSVLSDKRYHRFYRTNAHDPGRHGA